METVIYHVRGTDERLFLFLKDNRPKGFLYFTEYTPLIHNYAGAEYVPVDSGTIQDIIKQAETALQ